MNILPKGVKIISILGIIISIVLLFIGICLTISGFGVNTSEAAVGRVWGPIILVLSILQLIFCVFTLKRKNWARIAFGVFALIGGGTLIGFLRLALLTFMVSISNENQQNQILDLYRSIWSISGFIILGIMAFVFWYLLFNKKVKEAFSKN